MQTFISFSGPLSKEVGKLIHQLIDEVCPVTSPWISDIDVEQGENWFNDIAERINNTDRGIVVITKQNLSSPWIWWEAGALAGRTGFANVDAVLVDADFRDLSGSPLSAYQATTINDRERVCRLITQLNNASPSPRKVQTLQGLFGKLWPQFESSVADLVAKNPQASESRPPKESDAQAEMTALMRELIGTLKRPQPTGPGILAPLLVDAKSATSAGDTPENRIRKLIKLQEALRQSNDAAIAAVADSSIVGGPTGSASFLEKLNSALHGGKFGAEAQVRGPE
jgi:hypothetical protein